VNKFEACLILGISEDQILTNLEDEFEQKYFELKTLFSGNNQSLLMLENRIQKMQRLLNAYCFLKGDVVVELVSSTTIVLTNDSFEKILTDYSKQLSEIKLQLNQSLPLKVMSVLSKYHVLLSSYYQALTLFKFPSEEVKLSGIEDPMKLHEAARNLTLTNWENLSDHDQKILSREVSRAKGCLKKMKGESIFKVALF